MKRKKVLIALSIVIISMMSMFFLTGASKSDKWKTAPDIMIITEGSKLSGEGKYRWISDTMVEVMYAKGHTWIVREDNILIRTTKEINNK